MNFWYFLYNIITQRINKVFIISFSLSILRLPYQLHQLHQTARCPLLANKGVQCKMAGHMPCGRAALFKKVPSPAQKKMNGPPTIVCLNLLGVNMYPQDYMAMLHLTNNHNFPLENP